MFRENNNLLIHKEPSNHSYNNKSVSVVVTSESMSSEGEDAFVLPLAFPGREGTASLNSQNFFTKIV